MNIKTASEAKKALLGVVAFLQPSLSEESASVIDSMVYNSSHTSHSEEVLQYQPPSTPTCQGVSPSSTIRPSCRRSPSLEGQSMNPSEESQLAQSPLVTSSPSDLETSIIEVTSSSTLSAPCKKIIQCPSCPYSTSNPANMRRHCKLKTNPVKACKCKYCGQGFTTNQKCIHHEHRHTGVKNYKCSFCERRFFEPSDRHKHEKTHHKKVFVCRKCHEVFYCNTDLKNHVRRSH